MGEAVNRSGGDGCGYKVAREQKQRLVREPPLPVGWRKRRVVVVAQTSQQQAGARQLACDYCQRNDTSLAQGLTEQPDVCCSRPAES